MTGKRILMVEDDVRVKLMYCKALAKELPQDSISVAGNGVEAMSLLKQEQYDLVVTDVNMPLLDGGELYRLASEMFVQESREETPFIFCSGVKEALDTVKQLCHGSRNRFILKPFDLTKLQDVMSDILADQQRQSASLQIARELTDAKYSINNSEQKHR
jgi:DNA-binding response OmpR family regulator